MTPILILVVLALLFTVASFVWSNYPLIQVAVLLICIALLIQVYGK